MHQDRSLASGSSEPDLPRSTRCHTAPAKSMSAMDDLCDQCVPSFPPWYTTPMDGDCPRWHEQNEPKQTCSQNRTVHLPPTSPPVLSTVSRSFPAATGAPSRPPKRPKVRRATEKTDLPNRVFVGGLTPEINEDDLREIFGPFGELSTVYIKNRGGPTHRGFGFVTFKYRRNAEKVVAEYALEGGHDKFRVRGHELKIQPAFMHRKQHDSSRLQPQCQQPVYQPPGTPYYMPIPPIIRQSPGPCYSYAPYPASGVIVPYLSYYDGLSESFNPGYGFYGPTHYPGVFDPYLSEDRQYTYLDNINAGCSGLGYNTDYVNVAPIDGCPECRIPAARPASLTLSTASDQTYCATCSCCTHSEHNDASTLGDDEPDRLSVEIEQPGQTSPFIPLDPVPANARRPASS